jgi:peptidoglycan/xylan/chitin deacetylase (PgdA/CDA1 family)
MFGWGWLRRTGRLVLYAAALLGGAAAGHLHASNESQATSVTPAAVPVRKQALAEHVMHAVPQPARTQPIAPHLPPPAAYGGGRIIEGSTPHRLIYFTFDDGPDRRTTPLLLDRLDAVGVKATFFLTAGRIANQNGIERLQADLAREIVARGHGIGNHTVDHLQLPLLTDAEAVEQVVGAERIFDRVLGFHPFLVRPPGGAHSPRIDELLSQLGYTIVLWNLGAGDFQVKSPQEVLDLFVRVLDWREREQGERGGVVLLHDTHAWSVDAFQLIWAELWSRNCTLLARGEELYDIVPDLTFFYEPRGDGLATAKANPAVPAPWLLAERQERLRMDAKQRCIATDGF